MSYKMFFSLDKVLSVRFTANRALFLVSAQTSTLARTHARTYTHVHTHDRQTHTYTDTDTHTHISTPHSFSIEHQGACKLDGDYIVNQFPVTCQSNLTNGTDTHSYAYTLTTYILAETLMYTHKSPRHTASRLSTKARASWTVTTSLASSP